MAAATPDVSPKYRLANVLLGDDGPLGTFVERRRSEGESWRTIAMAVRDATDVDIAPETLRSWFPELTEAAT